MIRCHTKLMPIRISGVIIEGSVRPVWLGFYIDKGYYTKYYIPQLTERCFSSFNILFILFILINCSLSDNKNLFIFYFIDELSTFPWYYSRNRNRDHWKFLLYMLNIFFMSLSFVPTITHIFFKFVPPIAAPSKCLMLSNLGTKVFWQLTSLAKMFSSSFIPLESKYFTCGT